MNATETLMHDHELILEALGVLEALAGRAARHDPVPREPNEQLVGFFREFADRYHHANEEGELFPALERHGLPHGGGPIAVMLHEHEQGRALLRSLADLAGGLADAAGRERFADVPRAYQELLEQHIMKENEVLFRMAARMLTPAEDARIVAAFAEHAREVLGDAGGAAQRAVIDRLVRAVQEHP